jgi:O-antigen ligase
MGEDVMIKSDYRAGETSPGRWSLSSLTIPFTLVAVVMALLLAGAFKVLDISYILAIIVAILMIASIILRWDALTVALMLVIHICFDWYMGYLIVGQVLAFALLVIYFLFRSPQHPWTQPRALWLWVLYLLVSISPAVRGALSRSDAAYYYPNIMLGALLMFWLGIVIITSQERLATLFKILALVGALFAIHTIIETTTGVFLFETSRLSTYLTQVSDFQVANSDTSRAGSLLLNPDWNGAFFAMMLFFPVGLLAQSKSFLDRLLYLLEIFLMMLALLFTYTLGAWIAALGGMLAFVLLAGRGRYRILLPSVLLIVGLMVMVLFPSQVNVLLNRLANPSTLLLRIGAWQTAIQVIQAFPLTGLGLGLTVYLQGAEAYRVPAQYRPLAHPHNSYLELGAMGGLPVLLLFLALLLLAFWQAYRSCKRAEVHTCALLSGGLASVVALTVSSLSVNGWTLPPLAAIGWLVLGAMASRFVLREHSNVVEQALTGK